MTSPWKPSQKIGETKNKWTNIGGWTLFHVIDQARGFAFINSQPRNSDPLYPLYFSLGLLMIGFIGEYYTRQRASSSWLAKI